MPETTEFDDIIAQLKSERPEIDPAFARELDTRAADGFAKPRRRWRLSLPYIAVPAAGLAAAAIVVAGLSGSTGSDDAATGGGSSSSASGAATPLVAAQAEDSKATSQASADQARESAGGSAGVAAPEPPVLAKSRSRVQEQSAAISLVASGKDIADVGDRIIGVADQVGGFVESSNVRATDGDSGGGDFRLRVPVARLDDALARLSRLAHVSERTQGSIDITAERNMARERLGESKAERTSLLKRLADADTDEEVASLKGQLRDVNAMIASYRASLAQVNRRAQYAAVSVSLSAKPKKDVVGPADDGKWTPADAIRDAGRVLEVAAGALVLIGSVLVPLALLALLGLAGQRLAGRRSRARVLESV
jgi:hypothetical protein